ncbi:MAG: YbaB/EbfC family nucleoid-associated protein [Bacilli bacterium]|nr:YbaB/EbfC family nucleoid-associated protein [Bacilli bacterium]
MFMNMQAMLKQAQALQKDMLKAKEEIDNTDFVGESSLVKITMKGTKEVTKVEIQSEDGLDKDDIEMLEDMIVVAINDANKKIDKMTESKMSKFGNIPGLF